MVEQRSEVPKMEVRFFLKAQYPRSSMDRARQFYRQGCRFKSCRGCQDYQARKGYNTGMTDQNQTIIPQVSEVTKLDQYAYTIKDRAFGILRVENSANAWYRDRGKLIRLINAFKYDATIKEACFSAGISLDQYKYFVEKHPEFSTIIEACRQMPILRARRTVVDQLGTDSKVAMWYLARKRPEEFSTAISDNMVLMPRISMVEDAENFRPVSMREVRKEYEYEIDEVAGA